MRLDTLQDLLIDQLQDLWSAKRQIHDALPGMAHAAYSSDLKEVLEEYMRTTKDQIARIEEVLNKLGVGHDGKRCEGMEGLIREGRNYVQRDGDPEVKDTALITAARKIEHYELTGYGAARSYARELGYNDIADLLQETLDEEGESEKQLSSLARGGFYSTGRDREQPF